MRRWRPLPRTWARGPLQHKIHERTTRISCRLIGHSSHLDMVKDFERFLRQARNLKAEKDAELKTLAQHPELAPDLNAIESIWDLLQDRLLLTAPVEMESRCDFIKRLRCAVTWMNTNARAHMRGLCRNQKKRAAKVLKLKGARCSY